MSIILIAALFIMLTSLAGLLFAVGRVGNWVEENLIYLNTFAAGVFSIVSFNILQEAFGHHDSSPLITGAAVLGGFGIFFLAELLLPEAHCHHDDEKCVHAEKDKRKAWKVLLSDGVHNIGDGILLVPVFLIDLRLGVVATLGIIIHELVQEVAEFFVLKKAGYTTLQALQRNFFVSSSILIGVVLGSALVTSDAFIAPLIGFAAGGFIHIVLIDLIPLSIREARERKHILSFVLAFVLGLLVIFSVNKLSETFLEEYGLDGHGHIGEEKGADVDHADVDHADDDHADDAHE